MDGITDLLSNILYFLAWLLPIMFIILARRRSSGRRRAESRKQEPAAEQKGPPKKSDEGPSDFIARLMEIQGISYDEQESGEIDRSLPALEETEPAVQAPVYYRKPKPKKPVKAPAPVTDPLTRFDRYSRKRRALIFSEIIGKPKAMQDYD